MLFVANVLLLVAFMLSKVKSHLEESLSCLKRFMRKIMEQLFSKKIVELAQKITI